MKNWGVTDSCRVVLGQNGLQKQVEKINVYTKEYFVSIHIQSIHLILLPYIQNMIYYKLNFHQSDNNDIADHTWSDFWMLL